ncbi:MAG: protein translocase subunit SecD [bacterium]
MSVEKRTQNWILVAIIIIAAIVIPFWKIQHDEPAVKQGIDLVGGVDLLLEATPPEGESEITPDMMAGAIDIVRNRIDPEGVKELILQKMGDNRIVLQLPGEDDPEKVKRMIGETATLRFLDVGDNALEQGTKIRFLDPVTGEPIEGSTVSEEIKPEILNLKFDQILLTGTDCTGFIETGPIKEVTEAQPDETAENIPEAPAGEGTRGIALAMDLQNGKAAAVIEYTIAHPGEYIALIIDDKVRSVYKIEGKLVRPQIPWPGLEKDPNFDINALNSSLSKVTVAGVGTEAPEIGTTVNFSETGTGEGAGASERVDISLKQVILTGDDFASADLQFDRMSRSVIGFKFKSSGKDIFAKFTATHVNQFLAIALDDTIISCPRVNEPILQGQGIIEGQFTTDQVQELVIKLNSGRLPVKITVIENRTVGPTLGAKSIQDSKNAAILGAVLVLLYMLFYYRLPGLLADIALMFYMLVFFGALSLMNATLTLPGIAGFIVSVGMAVDANVLIFERLKEELRTGRTYRSALDAAFKRAFLAIFDSNVTTLITALVLYNLGTGPIRGFAVTLSLGILVSMFSALVVTRLLIEGVLNQKEMQKYWLYGVKETEVVGHDKGGDVR